MNMARSMKNLIAAVLIAVSGFVAWTQVLPVYNFTADLKTIIQGKSDLLASRAEIVNKISALSIESEGKYADLQKLALIIPETKNIPELISSADAIFAQSGVTLTNLKIGEIVGIGTESVNKISLELSGKGSYISLVSLIANFERHIRLNDLVFFSAQKDTNSLLGDTPTLSIQLTTNTYWLKAPSLEGNPNNQSVSEANGL